MATPIVLDTDIGTDIDDVYALILAVASPELDVRAVSTVNNDVSLRSRIAKKILHLAGCGNIPVISGSGESLTPGENRGWCGYEGRGMDLSDVPIEPADRWAAADRIAQEAERAHLAGHPLTLVTIGAMTNAALAIERHPTSMALVERIVAMASNFAGFGPENARPEHNVACDPTAVQTVLESGIPITLVGLNVTCQTCLTRDDMRSLCSSSTPLARAIAAMHHIWLDFIQSDGSPMHDPLALAYTFRPDLLTVVRTDARLRPDLAEAGCIEFNPPTNGLVTRVQVATQVNAPVFLSLLHNRVRHAVSHE